MTKGSAVFKVLSSLVWGIGTAIVIYSIKTDGAQSGWTELLFFLGLLGLLQSFSFVSFIMSSFHRGADTAMNTVEEKIWVDSWGRVVHRESDEGVGCFFALILWGVGILLTLVASAILSPFVFIINLCRASHVFFKNKIAAVIDVVIVLSTAAMVVWGFKIANEGIAKREAARREAAIQYARERAEENAQIEAERQIRLEQQKKERDEQEAQRKREYEAKMAAREAERQQKNAEKQAERERKKAEKEAKKIAENREREMRMAAQQAERERKKIEQNMKRQRRGFKKMR